MAESRPNPMQRPLPDGTDPEEEVARTENRWLIVMGGMTLVTSGVENPQRARRPQLPIPRCTRARAKLINAFLRIEIRLCE